MLASDAVRDLASDEKVVLAAIRDGAAKPADIKRPPRAARDAALDALVTDGWVARRKQGRSVLLELTEAGRAVAQALPVEAQLAPRPRAAGAVPVDLVERLDRIEQAIARLASTQERLLQLVVVARPSTPARADDDGADGSSLRATLLDAIASLDARQGHGGLVPIPALREELRQRGTSAPPSAVDAVLIALERDRAIELRVAQSPSLLADRAQGIERPGRGLVYYVSPRTP